MDATSIQCPKCKSVYKVRGSVTPEKKLECKKCHSSFSIAEGSAFFEGSREGTSGATVVEAKKDELIGTCIGGCRILKKLGQGGMGAVYKAQHLALDIPVAVKVLPPHFAQSNKSAVDRFVREARAAARLKHQNIVGVLNVGQEKGLHYIVMDFIDGKSLQQELQANGVVPVERALEIVRQCCVALEAARESDIVHRDIKPDNIMIDSKGMVKLADMGLAKSVSDDSSMTMSGIAMGTPHYMSPEQAEDARTADHRSDLYSLGCTFYRMICGEVPYKGDSLYKVMASHVNKPVPDPMATGSGIPRGVAAVIRKAMAKSPEDRYQTAGEMCQALDSALSREPKGSRGTVPARRSSRQHRKTRASVGRKKEAPPYWIGGIVAAVLMVGVLIGGLMSGGNAEQTAGAPAKVTEPAPAAPLPVDAPARPVDPPPVQSHEPPPQPGATVDLLPMIEPDEHVYGGRWWKQNGGLESDNFSRARLLIPYAPPAAYDFLLTFERLEQAEGLVVILPLSQRRPIALVLGAKENTRFGVAGLDETFSELNISPRDVELRKEHRLVVKVRPDAVEVVLDDRPVGKLPVELDKLRTHRIFTLPVLDALGLMTLQSPTRFAEIRLVEVEGRGRRITQPPHRHPPGGFVRPRR